MGAPDNMFKMTARDIRRNFLQYLSMIFITMLAVTLFCGFISNTLTLDRNVDAYFEKSNLTDLIAQFAPRELGLTISREDRNYFSELTASDLASACEYRFYCEGSADRKSAKIYAGPLNNSISKPLIASGIAGVLVDAGMKARDGYEIGRKIEVELPALPGLERLSEISLSEIPGLSEWVSQIPGLSEWLSDLPGLDGLLELAKHPVLEFEITGFMNFAEVSSTHFVKPVYMDMNVLSRAICVKAGIPADYSSFLSSLVPYMLYNQALLKTPDPAGTKASINAHYTARDDSNLLFIFDHGTIESVAALKGEVTTSLNMIYVFPVLFLLVSILVITTTAGALVLRERTNIGTLKGIGIPNGRIMLHYALFGAVLCFIGGVIGAAIGPLIVPKMMLIKYNLVYSMPSGGGIVFSLLWTAAAVFGVAGIALLIGIAACSSVIRSKPAECMRPAPPKLNFLLRPRLRGGKNAAAAADGVTVTRKRRLLAGVRGQSQTESPALRENYKPFAPAALPFKMAVRNIILKPVRALMTIIGVTGCVALLVCSFGIGDTVNNSIEVELGGQFYYDVSVFCLSDSADNFLDAMEELKDNGEIANYEKYKAFYMSAVSASGAKDIRVFSIAEDSVFTVIKPKDGVLISKATADDLKIKTGDALALTSGANTYDVKISGIVDTAATKGVFVSSDMFDQSLHVVGVWIEAEVTDGLLDFIKSRPGVQDATTMAEVRKNVNEATSSIGTIRLTMMVFSIALSVVVLYNLSLLNVKERHRSLATLKVLGFSDASVSSSLIYEIMMLVLLGTAAGLLLGFPVLYLVLAINKIELIAFLYRIKPISYVLSTLISVVTAAGINLIFGLLIKRIKMIDSLKSVE